MKATATTHTVNINDVVTKSKVQRMDWSTGRLVEIQGYTLEVGQRVLYAEAYGARSWWVCISEPTTGDYPSQKLVEPGGKHRVTTWTVNEHDQSTDDVFGIGLYYDNSGERLTAEEIAKHVRAAEIQSRWNDRREANQKKAEAAERAALRQQWAGILTPLEDVKDWREREKTEKANIINYLKNCFPGVRFTARKSYGSFCISWADGPSVPAVETACSVWHDHTFNGYEDYNEYTPSQFNRLFGGVEYSINTNRKNSPEAVQAAREALAALCPELADLIGTGKDYDLHGDGQEWLDMTVNRRDDDQARAFYEAGKHQGGFWYRICPDAVLRVYLEDQDRTQHTTTPAAPKHRKAQSTDTTTDTDEAPADGLQLVEIPGGVAVIGDSRTTYRNRKAIKAHGARWNRDAQQWQATDPEAVAALRAWFGVDDDPTPDPDGTAAPADNATAAADDTTTDQQATDTAESATEATESGKKYVFGFEQFDMLKEKHPDALLLFRCGDFYECYRQDAHTVADLLGIITTNRPDGVTVCAFPHHALATYLPRLIRAGHRVAICDQLQDERVTKRIAKRGITATVSAGIAQAATEAAQAPETTTTDQQATEAPKAQQSAQDAPKNESDGGELFTVHGETFNRGDRVTIDTTTDGHTTTEAGTLTDYARGQALAEVTTDDGRRVYGFFGSVKHAPTDPTPTPGGKGDGDGTQTAKENESPVIGGCENDRICTAQDGISPNGIEADAQTVATPGTFGDLCWDTYGKASAIVFGNIDDHAAKLEALGGVRREVNYHPLRTVKARRGDRMEAYYFDKRHARNAGSYVARVNHALLDAVWKARPREKQAADYKAGDRVRTIYGPGVVIDGGGLHAPSKNCVWVRLNGTTYNYGPKGLPHTFVEVLARDMIAEGESPVIEPVKNDRISTPTDGISPDGSGCIIPEWAQTGQSVGMMLDYGDGTGDMLFGKVTAHERQDDGGILVHFGGYIAPLNKIRPYTPADEEKVITDSSGSYVHMERRAMA